MLIAIPDMLTPTEITAMRNALDTAQWTDGAYSAQGHARSVKKNRQGAREDPAVKGVVEMVKKRLLAHPVFVAAARPDRFARLLVSRYGEGDGYGRHVDAPYIDGVRTDISFTLFLSDPGDYDGGGLAIDEEETVRLPQGGCFVYPADRLHAVETVTRGERLAIVGWVRSRIKSAEERALLFDLDAAIADCRTAHAPRDALDRLTNVRNNLMRRFGD